MNPFVAIIYICLALGPDCSAANHTAKITRPVESLQQCLFQGQSLIASTVQLSKDEKIRVECKASSNK